MAKKKGKPSKDNKSTHNHSKDNQSSSPEDKSAEIISPDPKRMKTNDSIEEIKVGSTQATHPELKSKTSNIRKRSKVEVNSEKTAGYHQSQETRGHSPDTRQKSKRSKQERNRNLDSEISESICSHSNFVRENFPLQDRIIEIEENDSTLIALLENETLTIYGKARLRSLFGNVCVLGYEISPSNSPYNIYSPNCNSFLTISNTSIFIKSNLGNDISKSIGKTARNKINDILNSSRCSAVIELVRLNDPALDYVTNFDQFEHLFFGSTKRGHKENIFLKSSQVEIVLDEYANRVRISEDFLNVRNEIVNDILTGNSNVKIALCGGKNVGKSTMCRYLVNTLLNSTEEIAFLECDVGQSEFTPSGCVSLSIVTKPLLGPPFTHLRQPKVCCYYSALNPSEDSEEYLRCVRQVHQQYTVKYSHLPLVINTMGWNKGIGISLLVDTLQMTQPNCVIQLDSVKQYNNLPCMRAEYVKNTPAWLSDLEDQSKEDLDYKILLLQSSVDNNYGNGFTAADHRTLTLMSYLGELGTLLNIAQPYCVPWDSVALYANGVANNHIMYALNCSIVALYSIPAQQVCYETQGDVKLLKKLPRSGCVGFGLIRGIDPEKKLFYIVTPVSSHILQSVNALIHGAVDVPQQILLKQKTSSSGDCPYVGYPKDIIGASSIKPRRHMVRHFTKNLPQRH